MGVATTSPTRAAPSSSPDQVYPLRLDLSRTGALPGGTVGYNLLDNQGITSTQFQQRIAWHQGEIANHPHHGCRRPRPSTSSCPKTTVQCRRRPPPPQYSCAPPNLAPEQVQTIVNPWPEPSKASTRRSHRVGPNGMVRPRPAKAFDRAGRPGLWIRPASSNRNSREITSLLSSLPAPAT